LTNRQERRAGKKLAKKGKVVMFGVSAPVFENIICIRATGVNYDLTPQNVIDFCARVNNE